MTLQTDQAAVWDYITSSTSSLRGRPPSGSVVSSLKHRISKREYKVVLSKTYVRTKLLMLRYQGKGKWGCNAESFDLAILYFDYIDLRREAHTSPSNLDHHINTPPWILPRLPHEEATQSTHTYLGNFRVSI